VPRKRLRDKRTLSDVALLALFLMSPSLCEKPAVAGQIEIPPRKSEALFEGKEGKQRTEIRFDPSTGIVTIKLLVQDPSGYFIPNIRRENFVVYENGVPQHNATTDIEHAAVSLGLLMEYGGRYQALNKILAEEVTRAGHELVDVVRKDDKIAIWTYGNSVDQVADFSQGQQALQSVLYNLKPPDVSETNLYDALISALERMRPVSGRKALLLISSGVDTFSKAKFEDVLNAIHHSDTPIYIISLGMSLREAFALRETTDPLARVDWKRAENELLAIATASGGRAYSPRTIIDLAAPYDDIMENLRLRYVITYKSSTDSDMNTARAVRIELVDPKTRGPLEIVDTNGKTIRAKVIVEDSYIPAKASERKK
jgi:Ca-activated chloride channel family protein